MIDNIIHNHKTLAIIIRSNYNQEGIKFFTPSEFSQQLGYMNRPKGYEIAPHLHNKIQRSVEATQETLLIKSGKVRIDFYDEKKDYLISKILYKGDVILLITGGHGFEMLEQIEIIEIKQGPYHNGDADKTRLKCINKYKIKIE
jgi:hypothetical protein